MPSITIDAANMPIITVRCGRITGSIRRTQPFDWSGSILTSAGENVAGGGSGT